MYLEEHMKGKIRGAEFIVAVPTDITDVEKRAFFEMFYKSKLKPKSVLLCEKPIADAVGLGLDVNEPTGIMVVDIGADTTEISVISLGGLVLSDLLHFGGNRIDESIITYVKRTYNLVIGQKTAQALKEKLGSGIPGNTETMVIVGRDVVSGLPIEMEITGEVVYEAIKDNLNSICNSIKMILEKTPPELAKDIIHSGIYITGGSSQIHNLSQLFKDITGIEIKESLRILQIIETQVDEVWDAVMDDQRQMKRWKGVGILDKQVARDFSPVGPNIRGSGIKRDTRYDHPYDFFKQIEFNVAVVEGGDVFAREMVRYMELKSSVSIIRQCFELMPQTPIIVDPTFHVKPENYALAYVEAPRGENVHWIMQGSAQKVYRWRCRAATYNNWPSLRFQFRGNTIADAALIVCSLDPCYSCTERVTVVDIKSKKSKILTNKDLKEFSRTLKNSPMKDLK
jgi:MreB/Mrl family cell shape determining protein